MHTANKCRVKTKLFFFTTAVNETAVAIDRITDGDYVVKAVSLEALDARIMAARETIRLRKRRMNSLE